VTARTAGGKSVTRATNKFKKIVKRWTLFNEIENLWDGRDSDTDDDLPFQFFRREKEVDHQPADQEQEAFKEEKGNNQREDEQSSTATDKIPPTEEDKVMNETTREETPLTSNSEPETILYEGELKVEQFIDMPELMRASRQTRQAPAYLNKYKVTSFWRRKGVRTLFILCT